MPCVKCRLVLFFFVIVTLSLSTWQIIQVKIDTNGARLARSIDEWINHYVLIMYFIAWYEGEKDNATMLSVCWIKENWKSRSFSLIQPKRRRKKTPYKLYSNTDGWITRSREIWLHWNLYNKTLYISWWLMEMVNSLLSSLNLIDSICNSIMLKRWIRVIW